MSKPQETAPEDCPEPGWHETHRYCPCCTWTEPPDPNEELQKAYNALCSAESSLDKANAGHTIRGRLAQIRQELGQIGFPVMKR